MGKAGVIATMIFYLTAAVTLVGCNNGDTSSSDATSTNFPYLLSEPKISLYPSNYTPNFYDVTVELDATGPDPLYSIGLWIRSKTNSSIFTYLELQPIGGDTWSATTNTYLPMPKGEYYIDSITIEDGDIFGTGLVKSAWYFINPLISYNHYTIDQRLTDYDPNSPGFAILKENVGASNITIVNFAI